MKYFTLSLGVLLFISNCVAVDRTNFKTCAQSSFCRRARQQERNKSTFVVTPKSHELTPTSLKFGLTDTKFAVSYTGEIYAVQGGVFRLKINELSPRKERFEVPYVLNGEPALQKLDLKETSDEGVWLESGSHKVFLAFNPFQVDFYEGNEVAVRVNQQGLLRFEFLREKPQPKEGDAENSPTEIDGAEFSVENGAWEENFKSHHDSKPNGPEAVALDFTFPDAKAAYGLPEHADPLALKTTKTGDPYRLFNLDVFEYELDNEMALYAAIPLLYSHGPKRTSGVFWLNAAETWVDVASTADQNVISSLVNLVSGAQPKPQIEAHFISESGIIDAFILMGPRPDDVYKQYTSLTGVSPMPQLFSLAYHQSRWNYMEDVEVSRIANQFDDYDIPMDVMWLDIEYTDNKKYFTWDPIRFSNPLEMMKNLTEKGRKLVAIIDSHYKRDSTYFLHNEAQANGYYVKTREGKDYDGWCWPGSSGYLDLLDPKVRDYLSDQYSLDKFLGSTQDTYIWNDMNEPSVFNGPEITMPRDIVHINGWEHRDLHNLYGFLYTMTTFEGLLKRSNHQLRPFILTRSAFAGSQRHAAIWTGDNMADWDHLKISIPMCLSLSLGGMAYCGADIGGFFKYPDAELFARWYQAGAWQTFYRAHSHIDTKRREPWLMGEPTTSVIRAAIKQRYSFLPYWYTLSYEHEKNSALILRPLYTEYPEDEMVYKMDDQYLVGRGILVKPVTETKANSIGIFLPGVGEVWYDADTFQAVEGRGYANVPVDLFKVPVFYRGGFIIPKKERIRRASPLMKDDPYTLIVALDKNGEASGTLYIDDEQSYDYRNGKFLYLNFTYKDGVLAAKYADQSGKYDTKSWLERVVVLGVQGKPKQAELKAPGESGLKLQLNYSADKHVVIVRKPGINMAKEWTINIK